jgi:class 3 adenylate cyclase
MAARLSSFAKPGQVVVSNLVYRELSDDARKLLQSTEPVEAKNVGNIKAWAFDGTNG